MSDRPSVSVSVVVPTFDSAATIEATLASVAAQTVSPTEVIVVDDASRDDTRGVVRNVAAQMALDVRLIELADNVGPATARNHGWNAARGEFVAFLDADDRWHPRKLELQEAVMRSRPELAMSCHAHGFDPDGPWANAHDLPIHDVRLRDFLLRNRCATPTVMVRRDLTERFDDGGRYAEDYLLWMRIAHRHGPIARIDVPLTQCANPRYGGTGLSGRLWAMERAELDGFVRLKRDGAVGTATWLAASAFSLAKFVVRLVDTRVVRIRRR